MIREVIVSGLFLAAAAPGAAAARERDGKASVEFAPASRAALASVEVALSDPSVTAAIRQPVSDLAMFVFKPGGDVTAALRAANGDNAQAGKNLFGVRLFVVAGGRLYTQARGQCGGWDNDVSVCTGSCDGGGFALRRSGSASLDLLVGVRPGGADGEDGAISLGGCGLDETSDVKLVTKAAGGLAVIGFDGN